MLLPFIRHSMNLFATEKYGLKYGINCTSYYVLCDLGFFNKDDE